MLLFKILRGNMCLKLLQPCSRKNFRSCQTAALNKTVPFRLHGQPTPSSHPHLLEVGELTPGLTPKEFQKRRLKLMELIIKNSQKAAVMSSNHLVILPASSKVFMSHNIPYTFRQSTDFLYFSGFKEPDSVIVLHTNPGKELPDFVSAVFIPKSDSHIERWEGPKTDIEGAVEFLGVDSAHYVDDLQTYLHSYASLNSEFSLWYDYTNHIFSPVKEIVQDFLADHNKIRCESPHYLIQKLRLIKSPSEAKLMRKTCQYASESMLEVMKFSHAPVLESHLHAKMEYECRIRGADYLAFPPVVAGGSRANSIHYLCNDQMVKNGEMVLMDAGCEVHGYSSDITRTWPVSGKFSDPQKQIYQVVLSTQEELIKLCATFPTLDYLFEWMCRIMGEKLQDLGIIPRTATKSEVSKTAYSFCPHHVSHYLGMDVHDTHLISRGIKIEPGMVITVEPGLYFREDDARVTPQYRGLCVRIEDDVLITEEGPEVLTSFCPKTVEDIEQVLRH